MMATMLFAWLFCWLTAPDQALHFGVCQQVAQRHAEIAARHYSWTRAGTAWDCEARHCYSCWSNLSQALNCPVADDKRMALWNLHWLLRPEDYYAGVMPPPVPLWRFREVDNPSWRPP